MIIKLSSGELAEAIATWLDTFVEYEWYQVLLEEGQVTVFTDEDTKE